MSTHINELTNVKQEDYVPFISSVLPLEGSILPDRFTSTSGPVNTPLASPGFNSDSGPKEQIKVTRSKQP